MVKKKVLIILGVFLATAALFAISNQSTTPKKGLADGVLSWSALQDFDFKTGTGPKGIMQLHQKRAKIAGYVVPLEDEYSELREFIVVPTPQSCIHDPSPPPNLIIHVKLAHPLPKEKVHNPAWIEGTFLIETTKTEHVHSAFKLNDATLDEYK